MQYKVSFLLALLGSFLANIIEFFVILIIFSRVPRCWPAGRLPRWRCCTASRARPSRSPRWPARRSTTSRSTSSRARSTASWSARAARSSRSCRKTSRLRRMGRVLQGAIVLVSRSASSTSSGRRDKAAGPGVRAAERHGDLLRIFVLGGAFCFWTTQGKEATHVFTYGGDALARIRWTSSRRACGASSPSSCRWRS